MKNYNEIIEKLKDIFSEELGNKKIYDIEVSINEVNIIGRVNGVLYKL